MASAVVNPWRFTVLSQRTRLDVFSVYTNFIDNLDVLYTDRRSEEVNELYQFGMVLVPDDSFKFGFIKLSGFGISLLAGDGVQAIRFHTGFPF